MCWAQAAGAGAQAGFGAIQTNNANIAANEQSRKQTFEQLRANNIQDANLRLQQAGLMDTAMDQKSQLNLQRIQALGTINAAIGESNLEGNSMDRVKRVTEAEFVRAAARVDDNYQRDYASLFTERVSGFEETKRSIDYANNNEAKIKSPLEIALDPLDIGIGTKVSKAFAKIPGGGTINKGYNKALSLGRTSS